MEIVKLETPKWTEISPKTHISHDFLVVFFFFLNKQTLLISGMSVSQSQWNL